MYIWLILMALVVFLDQLTKYLAVIFLKPVGSFPLWKDVFHFTYSTNTGMAFGMLGEENQRWVFMTVSTLAIVGFLVYLFWKKPQRKLECIAISFVVGGGIGNMIDRIVMGKVVDFLDFTLIDFAIFNVADSFVCIGAGLFMLSVILDAVREYRAENAALAAVEAPMAKSSEDADGEDTDGSDYGA